MMGENQFINVRHFDQQRRDELEPRPSPAAEFENLGHLMYSIRLHNGYHYLDISNNGEEISGARIDSSGRIGASAEAYERDLALSSIGWLINPELNSPPNGLSTNASFLMAQKIMQSIFSEKSNLEFSRIIFALPSAHFDGDLDFSRSSLGINIKAATGTFDVNEQPSKVIYRKLMPKLNDIWLKTNASMNTSYYNQNSYRAKENLLEFIQYQFSDGEIIPFSDLPYHPYAVLVPNEALPIAAANDGDEYDIFEKYAYKLSNNETLSPIYTKTLKKIITDSDIPVVLTYRKHRFSDRPGLLVKTIEEGTSQLTKWNLGWKNNRVTVMAELSLPDNSELFYYSGLIIDSQQGRILSTNFEQQTKLVRKVTGNFSFSSEDSENCVRAHCELEDLNALALVNGRLRKMLKEEFGVKVPKLEIQHIESDQFSLQIALDSKNRDQFKVLFLHNSSGETYQPVSEHQFRFLIGLLGGLGKFFSQKNTDLASEKKNFSRQNDLKLLRHCGIYNHLILEYLSTQHDPNLEDAELFQKHMVKTVLHSFQKIIDKKSKADPAEQLSELFSPKLTKLIEDWIQNLFFVNQEEHYFLVDGKLSSTHNFDFFLHIVELIARTLTSAHGKKLVSKQSFKDTSIEGADDENKSLSFNAPFAYDHVLNAIDENFELLVDGQQIESVGADDVHTQIEVASAEDSIQKIDWFELHPKIFFKGQELSMADATKLQQGELLQFDGKYYRIRKNSLPRLKWLDFFWQNLSTTHERGKSDKESSFVTLPKSQVLNILALKKAGVEVIGGEKWKLVERQFEKLAEPISNPSPEFTLSAEQLKDYQCQGLKWLDDISKLQLGGILADDMGLGKTVQALALLDLMRQENRLHSALIVVPTTLVYNWMQEGKKFFPHLPITVFDRDSKEKMVQDTNDGKGLIYLCSYGMMVEHQQSFLQCHWSIIFFDEAQNLKNISAKRTGVARMLKAGSKFCLTGTPMENHYGEFFSLIDLVVSGALGGYREFMSIFSPQKMRANNAEFDKRHIEFLKLKTAPLILRRSKKNILQELPEKTETIVHVPFEENQLKIYRDVAISWNNRIREKIEQNGESATQIEMLTALLRLRQICSYPAAVPKVTYNQTPPKLELLCDSLTELYANGESALVFTTFLSSLGHIEKMLKQKGIFCAKLTGDMNQKQRIAVLQQFEQADVAVLLMTLKTGGVGLNLTKASYVFHVEPWWNPAAEDQATDRVHRIGQTQKVQVYRYIVEHSVEEKIQQLKGVKAKAFQALFSDDVEESEQLEDAHTSSQLTQKDFEFLLS